MDPRPFSFPAGGGLGATPGEPALDRGNLSARREEGFEDGLEDAGVAVGFDFDWGVDSAGDGEFGSGGFGGGADGDVLAGFEVFGDDDVEGSEPGEAEGGAVLAAFVLEGEDAHAAEVGAVDAFVGLGDAGF